MQGLSCDQRTENERKKGQTAIAGVLENELQHYENPQTDEEKLMNYQYEFLINGSKKAWSDLWVLSMQVSERILANICAKRKLHLSAPDWEDKKSDAVTYVLRRYKTTPGYYVKKNFVLQIWYGVKHVLDYRTKADVLIGNIISELNKGEINLDV